MVSDDVPIQRSFRVVLFAGSRIRLQERPADPAADWTVNLTLNDVLVEVIIRDVVDESGELPSHSGLELQIVTPASDIDEAVNRARHLAALYASALSTAARGAIDVPRATHAYEITPGVERRELMQWHADIQLPLGKTATPQAAFGPLQDRLVALSDPIQSHLLTMAVQFYSGALRETDGVLRFLLLWPAAEALDDPLRACLTRAAGDQRFWGLKALARELGHDPTVIDEAYDMRNDLFHVRPGATPAALAEKAKGLSDQLEALVAPAIYTALGVAEAAQYQPGSATIGYPIEIIVRGVIAGDVTAWTRDNHPQLTPHFELARTGTDEAGSINARFTTTFTVENCTTVYDAGYEIWGPTGTNVGQIKINGAKITRASGEEEALVPDA